MSDRQKPHNGRDGSGHFKVKQEDVEDLRTDPQGTDFIRDDVRLSGAVEDTGSDAGQRGTRISETVEQNRDDVERVAERNREDEGR